MKTITILLALTLFSACNTQNKNSYASISENIDTFKVADIEHPGKQLMENNCYVCHNPKTSQEAAIAPPMIAIKKHYINANTSKEEFVNSMILWTKKPSEDKTKMPGAIARFGLMPYQFYPEETISQIADYMYDNEIAEPDWFAEHFNQMKGRKKGMQHKKGKRMRQGQNKTAQKKQNSPQERGMQMAMATKAELGKNLMGQIQKNGTTAALQFCNLQAYPLTDSIANLNQASIKRVTDKPRNSKNQANKIELQHIKTFKKQVTSGMKVNPIVTKTGSKVAFYYPITTNTMCLQCHGTPNKEVNSTTLSILKDLYPTDKATGYSENQVRGMWSIHFNEE